MILEDGVHVFRLRLVARAQQLGNVSKACREYGISRTLFYRWRERYLAYGADGLRPHHQGPQWGRPPLLSLQDERAESGIHKHVRPLGPAFVGATIEHAEFAVARSS